DVRSPADGRPHSCPTRRSSDLEAMRAEATRLLDLEADLRRAINADAFVPWYQPIVDMSSGEVAGYEALLRWNHETRGTLAPADLDRKSTRLNSSHVKMSYAVIC